MKSNVVDDKERQKKISNKVSRATVDGQLRPDGLFPRIPHRQDTRKEEWHEEYNMKH